MSQEHTNPILADQTREVSNANEVALAPDQHNLPASSEIEERTRHIYIDKLKKIHATPTAPEHAARDLWPTNQSILHQLAVVETISMELLDKRVGRELDQLDKVPFLTLIGEHIGHRPASFSFTAEEYAAVVPHLEEMLARSPVYLKANKGFRGEYVVRIVRTPDSDGYTFAGAVGSLEDYRPRAGYLPDSDIFIAEEEIPIARTEDGRTWEVRLLPPLGDEYCHGKIGKGDLNNIAQGGEVTQVTPLLDSVIRRRFPDADSDEIVQRSSRFMDAANGLAGQVKDLSDAIQISIAQGVIKPADLKDPSQYEAIMTHCFSGNFLTVDITGVWDEKDELVPMIIEAQTSARLPDNAGNYAYEQCRARMSEKIRQLQAALI